jgi:hypothetical protein
LRPHTPPPRAENPETASRTSGLAAEQQPTSDILAVLGAAMDLGDYALSGELEPALALEAMVCMCGRVRQLGAA